MTRYLDLDAAWLHAKIRVRLREMDQANGTERYPAYNDVIDLMQQVLDAEGWAITRRAALPEDAPLLRLTWPHDGRKTET
jgi:hypothetical protein